MKNLRGFFWAMLLGWVAAYPQIALESDFSLPANMRETMRFHWDIFNRISPDGGLSVPKGDNTGVCLVRPLGGKATNGQKDLSEDTYKWNGTDYYYDWAPLKKQINSVLAEADLFQLMIDNAPWAFQRGVDRNGFPEIDTYGNAWPPNDPKAWADYIKAMLEELIKTYGRQEVGKWQFCIGREIGTGGHWRAGQAAFFEHYGITEKAIRQVLPDAKVGAHFLWASAPNSYGPAFVKWCKANASRYDFIGVSYYPFYDQANRVDIGKVYKNDFAPIKDQPDWNPSATLEIHEFALIKSMNQAGNGFVSASSAYQESFSIMLAKMMHENGMNKVFRWGSGDSKSPALQAMAELQGSNYYTSSSRGTVQSEGSMVNAIFARNVVRKQYDAVAYNYNANPGALGPEVVDFRITLPALAGTNLKYRTASYQKATGTLQWSAWLDGKTLPGTRESQSVFTLGAKVESFSFLRLQMIPENEVADLRRSATPSGGYFPIKRDAQGNPILLYLSQNRQSGFIEIADPMGRALFRQQVRLQAGSNSITIPAAKVPSGPHFVRVAAERETLPLPGNK